MNTLLIAAAIIFFLLGYFGRAVIDAIIKELEGLDESENTVNEVIDE